MELNDAMLVCTDIVVQQHRNRWRRLFDDCFRTLIQFALSLESIFLLFIYYLSIEEILEDVEELYFSYDKRI